MGLLCLAERHRDEESETNQSRGETNDADRCLCRLRHIKQVVQQRLIVVLSKEIKLIQ